MPTKAEIQALRDRWAQFPGFEEFPGGALKKFLLSPNQAHPQEVKYPWPTPEVKKGPLATGDSPFGLTEAGLRDYRGVLLNDALCTLTLEGVDFSYLTWGIGHFVCWIRKCLFIGADVQGCLSQFIEDCDFTRATFRRGSILQGEFTACTFVKARFSLEGGNHTVFTKCSFDEADLKTATFYDCRFVQCSFVGTTFGKGALGASLAGSIFEDCRFSNPNFSQTILRGTKGLEQFPGLRR